jgi:hypothetical protein
LGPDFVVDLVVERVDDRLDVAGEGLDGGAASTFGSFTSGTGVGSVVAPLASTVGAGSEPGMWGRTAATVDEPACSDVVNVITVAAATVVITAAAANLYSLVGGTVKLPWTRTLESTTPSTVAGRTAEVTSNVPKGRR